MFKKLMPFTLAGLLIACSNTNVQDVTKTYIKDGQSHPLVVLLGGSEGGNTLGEPAMETFRMRFNEHGISVAALGYYGTENTPSRPIELSLNEIADKISELASEPAINGNCVAVMGFSKGAELALLLGSHFEHINHVVGIMPTHVSWNAVKTISAKSGWQLHGKPLDFIEAPLVSWNMQKGNFTGEFTPAFQEALEQATPEQLEAARIPVERTNGPVLLVSAIHDEVWPSYEMAKNVEASLQANNFIHRYEHNAIDDGHYSFSRKEQRQVHEFLKETLVEDCQ